MGGLITLTTRLIAWVARRWVDYPEPDIRPPRVLFAGHDEAAQQRTAARRAEADALRRTAGRVETRDERTWATKRRVG